MAVINKRVDDYLYNSKGEEVEGAKKRTIAVPAILFGGKRSVKHSFDTSDKGDKAFDRDWEKLEEQIVKLAAPLLKNMGFDGEKYAARQSGKDEAEKKTQDANTDSQATTASTEGTESVEGDLTEEDLEAATSPSGSDFGSNNY